MKKSIRFTVTVVLAALIILVFLSGPVLARSIERNDFGPQAVEINFDDLPSGTFVGDLYLSSGVSFNNAVAVAGSYPVSYPNVITSSDGLPISIHFPTGVIRVGISIDTDGYNLGRQPQMRAFDKNGNLLGIQDFGQGPDFVVLEFPGTLIAAIQLGSTNDGDPTGPFFFSDAYDNLIFEAGFAITYLNTHTFIATDAISLKAQLYDATPNVGVQWTVIGLDAASGISGFPVDEVHLTDNDGVSIFTFTPSANQNLVNNRRTNLTGGSYKPNTPISFDVIVEATVNGEEFQSRLSQTGLGPLQQDETDRLRQEYYDYEVPIPTRDQVIASLGPGYNRGNYNVQVSVDLPTLYNDVVSLYHGRQVIVPVVIDGQSFNVPTKIPDNASVTISSGYRNPQRNKAIGSLYPNSKHVQGTALDLVPGPVQVLVEVNLNGQIIRRRVTLDLHSILYPALQAAGETSDTNSICEFDSEVVTCDDITANHVHVNWKQ